MITTISNTNFISYNNIPLKFHTIFYSDLFFGDISNIILKKLLKLTYNKTEFCINNKIIESPQKMIWLSDNNTWNYVMSDNHMHGLNPTEFPLFIRCIQFGIQKILGKKFNSCLIKMYEKGQQNNDWTKNNDEWLGNEFIVPCVVFGNNLNKFETKDKKSVKLKNGSMIVLRDKNTEYNITHKKKDDTYFVLTFYNVQQDLVTKMPRPLFTCIGEQKTSPQSLNNMGWKCVTLPVGYTLYRGSKSIENLQTRSTYFAPNILTSNMYLPTTKKGYLYVYKLKKPLVLLDMSSVDNANRLLRETFDNKTDFITKKKYNISLYDAIRSFVTGSLYFQEETKPHQIKRILRGSFLDRDFLFADWLCKNNFTGYFAPDLKSKVTSDFPSEIMLCEPLLNVILIETIEMKKIPKTNSKKIEELAKKYEKNV